MRILFVSHSFPPADRPLSNVGGMQRVATELYSSLSSRTDVRLSTLVLRSSWRWTHLRSGPFLANTLRKIYGIAVRGDVDVVLFSSMVTAAMALPLKHTLRAHGVLSAAIVHGRDVTLDLGPYQKLVPRIFDSLDAVFPVSRATGDACIARGLDPDKLFVVPNGIAIDRFRAITTRDTGRAELIARFGDPLRPFPEKGLILCSVGRQVKRKGFAWFVESVLPLLPQDVHYWLAGEGPEAERIIASAQRHKVSDRVRLLGRVTDEDLALLYSGADLFIMPNVPVAGDMEGFGVVMLEAGLSGLLTIGSRLEGITDVIEDGSNGHLVTSGDAWGFSEAIMRYYHDPRGLRAAHERASEHVRSHFSWDAVADRYVNILSALVQHEPASVEEEIV